MRKHSNLQFFTYFSTLQCRAPDSQRSHRKSQGLAHSLCHDIQPGMGATNTVSLSASSQGPAVTSRLTGPQLKASAQEFFCSFFTGSLLNTLHPSFTENSLNFNKIKMKLLKILCYFKKHDYRFRGIHFLVQFKVNTCKKIGAPFSFMEGNTSLKFFFFCSGRPSTYDWA